MRALFRTLIIATLPLLLMTAIFPSGSAAISSAENSLIDLYGQVRILEAVRVEIDRFALYQKGSRGFQEDRISEDLAVLHKAREQVRSVDLADPFRSLREAFVSAVDGVEKYADAILNFGAKEEEKAEEILERRYDRLKTKLADAFSASVTEPGLPGDFDPFDEEVKAFPDKKGREKFRQAAFLVEEKKFAEASALLRELRDTHRGTSAEGSIVLRMVRCITKDSGAFVPEGQEEPQIRFLQDLIASRVYYPNAYDIYLKWRTLYQTFYYGSGGDAAIPNLFYLQKLNGLIATVKDQADSHPQDVWARTQLWMLVQLPVIERMSAISGSGEFGAEGQKR